MLKPNRDNDGPIKDDMFDFLSEDEASRLGRLKGRTLSGFDGRTKVEVRKSAALPIIRKPVPISVSGPNQSQMARAASPERHQVRDAIARRSQKRPASDDDFDFLHEPRHARSKPTKQPRDFEFDEDWSEGFRNYSEVGKRNRKGLWVALALVGAVGAGTYFVDQTGRFKLNSQAQSSQASNNNSVADKASSSPAVSGDASAVLSLRNQFLNDFSRIESLVATGQFDAATEALVTLDPRVMGYGSPEFASLKEQIATGKVNQNNEEVVLAEEKRLASEAAQAEEVRLAAEAQQAEEARLAAEAQQAEEARLAAEAQQAEEARLAAEAQQAEEARLAAEAQQAEEARLAAEAQQAEEARLAAEAQQAEEARLAAEAQQAEEARLAAEAQQAEEARLAAEAQQAEEARLAAEAQQAEEARLAAEAQQAEEARLAEEARNREAELQATAERLEAERLEAAERGAAARRAARAAQSAAQSAGTVAGQALVQAATTSVSAVTSAPAVVAQVDLDRAATDRLLASSAIAAAPATPQTTPQTDSDRAATDRLLASVATAATATPTSVAPRFDSDRAATDRLLASTTRGEPNDQRTLAVAPISEADFQENYKRFVDVKTAIEQRDINLITQLAVTDGARVQALLQLFSNSQSVVASVDNVSTRNNDGTVLGTLTISEVIRRGGSTIRPPANLRSFTLTTQREEAGWSKIKW